MRFEEAFRLSEEVVDVLAQYCSRIEVAGSIRRRRPEVNDIDVVVMVAEPVGFRWAVQRMADDRKLLLDGSKIKRLKYKGVQVDIYKAFSETWATLLLIRTGSTNHNIRLCSLARSKGLKLKADGSGLFNAEGERVAGESEASIFEALGVPYKPPEERE